jgi:CBS domain-containing protein
MSATFASPVAAVLLAVELLLFEWKPRSLIPVALASATAGAVRRYIIGLGPLFPTPPHKVFIGPEGLAGCVVAGILAGGLSALLTLAVYGAEDLFQKHMPIHWMWWPAIGGLAVGLGGIVFPEALGVGYETIGALLQGSVPIRMIWGILLVKSFIWAFSLGSGTSGGVLAPLLMMGGALGGLETMVLPNEGAGFWPLISMGAILGGTMRSPFTGIVFAFELTHDVNVILPLLVASVIAHAFTSLTLKRSILTEKVARRGYHLSREYAVDPLEILFVHEVMRKNIAVLPEKLSPGDVPHSKHAARRGQRLYPVVTPDRVLAGVVTRRDLRQLATDGNSTELSKVMRKDPVVAHADEPLRVVVYRMAETGITRMPVVDGGGKLAGIISLEDLLRARVRDLEEERRRERVLRIHLPFGGARELEGELQPSGGSSGSKPDSSGVVG